MIMRNYLTIDVEDYYQVSAFENIIARSNWATYPSRVEKNTERILLLLDRYNVKATFFVLGWTAHKHPELVKNIKRMGHEIACHSYYHQLIYNLTPEDFRDDTRIAKEILEQIIGEQVTGYRAPSYSITQRSLWALEILTELGFQYDSSIFPIFHDRYGIPDSPRFSYKIEDHNMMEYPISTSVLLGKNIPVAGGGYFRLFPYWFTRFALQRINQIENKPFIFYIHPWEIDPEQPRMKNAGFLSRFRHYVNISKTLERFESLLKEFSFRPIPITSTAEEYLGVPRKTECVKL